MVFDSYGLVGVGGNCRPNEMRDDDATGPLFLGARVLLTSPESAMGQSLATSPRFSAVLGFLCVHFCFLGARLRCRMATRRSKKGSEKVLGRALGKGFSERF